MTMPAFRRHQSLRMTAKGCRAFTLLELLVVLVIISLLAGIVTPVYFKRAEAARLQKVQADFALLATALSLYKLDNHGVPTTAQGLQALVQMPVQSPLPVRYKPGGYLRELPHDPWGNDYLYLSPSAEGGKDYALWSHGADGARGGDGENADIAF